MPCCTVGWLGGSFEHSTTAWESGVKHGMAQCTCMTKVYLNVILFAKQYQRLSRTLLTQL